MSDHPIGSWKQPSSSRLEKAYLAKNENNSEFPKKVEEATHPGPIKGIGIPISQGLLAFLLIVILIFGWLGQAAIKEQFKSQLSDQIGAQHKNSLEAIKLWFQDTKATVDVWAENRAIRESAQALVSLTSKKGWTPKTIIKSEEMQKLRAQLKPVIQRLDLVGFVVSDTEGVQIGALFDEPIGKSTIAERAVNFQKTLIGETVISLPFKSEIALPDREGHWKTGLPTMFVSAPIRDQKENVIAVLSFRIRPDLQFSRILEIGRSGKTGETYAINPLGKMISKSRFNDQLKKGNLISNSEKVQNILNIQLRDPGGNISSGFIPKGPRERRPLTRMAASLDARESGMDMEGYNNYLGIPVVGVWTWIEEYGLGLATEIEYDEAYAPFNSLRKMLAILLLLLFLGWLTTLWMRVAKLREEKKREQVTLRLMQKQDHINAIMRNVMHGIITFDEEGRIETANHIVERDFGYSRDEMEGKNINMLVSEMSSKILSNAVSTIISNQENIPANENQELIGVRKDGSEFPIDLLIGKLNGEEKWLLLGQRGLPPQD